MDRRQMQTVQRSGVRFPGFALPHKRIIKNGRWFIIMRKLFALKNGRLLFYACVWDCGMYSIERITKSFGGTVAPLVGAWIEISQKAVVIYQIAVAPLVGAWIEIVPLCSCA